MLSIRKLMSVVKDVDLEAMKAYLSMMMMMMMTSLMFFCGHKYLEV